MCGSSAIMEISAVGLFKVRQVRESSQSFFQIRPIYMLKCCEALLFQGFEVTSQ